MLNNILEWSAVSLAWWGKITPHELLFLLRAILKFFSTLLSENLDVISKKKCLYQLHRFPLSVDSQQFMCVLWACVYPLGEDNAVLLFFFILLGLCLQILLRPREVVLKDGISMHPIKGEVHDTLESKRWRYKNKGSRSKISHCEFC